MLSSLKCLCLAELVKGRTSYMQVAPFSTVSVRLWDFPCIINIGTVEIDTARPKLPVGSEKMAFWMPEEIPNGALLIPGAGAACEDTFRPLYLL